MAAEQDLLAAAVMSGVEHATDAELGDVTAAEEEAALRRNLREQLGGDAFEAAHARLRSVVEDDDDDALVRDIQKMLGAAKLDLLPMLLKLIFIEEQGAQRA